MGEEEEGKGSGQKEERGYKGDDRKMVRVRKRRIKKGYREEDRRLG